MRWYTGLLGVATVLLIGLGGFLVYGAVSDTRNQLFDVLLGAFLMALGFVALVAEGRSVFRWWQTIRSGDAGHE